MSDTSKIYINISKNKYFQRKGSRFIGYKYAMAMMAKKKGHRNLEHIADSLSSGIEHENHSSLTTTHLIFYYNEIDQIGRIVDETINGHTVMSDIPYRKSSKKAILEKAIAVAETE